MALMGNPVSQTNTRFATLQIFKVLPVGPILQILIAVNEITHNYKQCCSQKDILILGSIFRNRKQRISVKKHSKPLNEFQVQIVAAVSKEQLPKHRRMLISFVVPQQYRRLNASSALLHAEIYGMPVRLRIKFCQSPEHLYYMVD